jgi:hypothetical protein
MLAGISLTLTDFNTLEQDAVGIGLQFEVVAEWNRRNQEADLLSKFLADAANATQQLAILRLVDQWNQAIAHFQAQHIQRRHIVPARFQRFLHGAGATDRGFNDALLTLHDRPGKPAQREASSRKTRFGIPGISPQETQDGSGDAIALPLRNICPITC